MRLGSQLLVLSLGVLALPWLGYRYLEDMRDFLPWGPEERQEPSRLRGWCRAGQF